MKALLISIGSRGDAEPFCALARALALNNHSVDLFLQQDVKDYAPKHGDLINVIPLPFGAMDMYKFVASPSNGADNPNPRVRFIGIITDCIGELVFPNWERILESAKTCDVIVTSSLGRHLSIAMSQKCGIPICSVNLQPLAPTAFSPHYSNADECVKILTSNNPLIEKDEYLDGHWELEKYHMVFLKERLEKLCASLDIPPLTFEAVKPYMSGHHDSGIVVNAFSSQIIRPFPDAGPKTYEIGALADEYIREEDWSPPTELVQFLESCTEPPICFGFGSMPFAKADEVVEAIKEIGKKVILVGDALKVETNDNIFHISSVPYPWLFPKCAMMVCHGGAGVVHAALRAGIPVVISPLMGDQFFFAKLLETNGHGAQAGASLTTVTKEEIVSGIEKALGCQEKTQSLGESIRAQSSGPTLLAKVLESLVAPQNLP